MVTKTNTAVVNIYIETSYKLSHAIYEKSIHISHNTNYIYTSTTHTLIKSDKTKPLYTNRDSHLLKLGAVLHWMEYCILSLHASTVNNGNFLALGHFEL